jgi:uncharacterized Fe-S cluster-containing protein
MIRPTDGMGGSIMTEIQLPGLDCGLCGQRTCTDFAAVIARNPAESKRCIHLSGDAIHAAAAGAVAKGACSACARPDCTKASRGGESDAGADQWKDSLGRDVDFYLEHFPEEPGPREIILPHNPMITREMEIKVGEVLIGRPLGMSCGCPVTHCGIVTDVDPRTGVIVWCVTGPLQPRQQGFRDLGYYIAEAYEGIVQRARCDIKIGMRYFFQPRMCMLQWRHSGLVNYVNRTPQGLQIRLEGLYIG